MGERPLWAPWRIDYITAPKDGECIFCVAAAGTGDGAGRPLERADHCFTMLNAFPYTSGHVMVVPDRHAATLDELSESELLELMKLVRRATAALQDMMAPDGFTVGVNLGTVAGAGFADHLHIHVVPRWEGDTNFMPVIGDTRVVPQALDATRAALVSALGRLA
jgi:ATP adenylyltransferase